MLYRISGPDLALTDPGRGGRPGVFLYLYWSLFDFVSIRELFGMAQRFIGSSEFWILDPGPSPEPPKSGPGWPQSGPLGPGRAWIFIGRVEDLVPGLAGRGGGPLRPPSGCSGERAQF